jgi:hypothetical protein
MGGVQDMYKWAAIVYGVYTEKYFYFSEDEFSRMVGHENWDDETFEVVQEGSQSWTGQVIVWKKVGVGKFESGDHGRRKTGDGDGQWEEGDTISLKSCLEA